MNRGGDGVAVARPQTISELAPANWGWVCRCSWYHYNHKANKIDHRAARSSRRHARSSNIVYYMTCIGTRYIGCRYYASHSIVVSGGKQPSRSPINIIIIIHILHSFVNVIYLCIRFLHIRLFNTQSIWLHWLEHSFDVLLHSFHCLFTRIFLWAKKPYK